MENSEKPSEAMFKENETSKNNLQTYGCVSRTSRDAFLLTGDDGVHKRLFNLIGWILLLGMLASWIRFGFLDFYLIALPATYVCFSISNGRIKRLKKIKGISIQQVILILFAFIASVGIVFGLIQLANYLINDLFQLTGWVKTLSQWTAVILSLYPVKFTFAYVVYKINNDLNAKSMR